MPKIPGINHLRAVKALEKAGFHIIRQGKKHIVMSDNTRFLTIPRSNPVNAYYGRYHSRCWPFCRSVPKIAIAPIGTLLFSLDSNLNSYLFPLNVLCLSSVVSLIKPAPCELMRGLKPAFQVVALRKRRLEIRISHTRQSSPKTFLNLSPISLPFRVIAFLIYLHY